ncbi:MAG: alanine dehydrogenase, partial [Deltaproteobacteria bacterium]|nr:alanine dehydrogenase [Deltaproteobacteria bacterium]
KFRYIDDIFGSHVKTLCSNSYNIEKAIRACDLLIGATHIPGARTPRLITRGMLSLMKKGSVIVDVSVDQGGCVETIRPTTHSMPTYEVDGVIHYGVANMPGAVPRTSTFALTNATLPYILKIANMGIKEAALSDPEIARGVNIHRGRITHQQVAEAFGKEFCPLSF